MPLMEEREMIPEVHEVLCGLDNSHWSMAFFFLTAICTAIQKLGTWSRQMSIVEPVWPR